MSERLPQLLDAKALQMELGVTRAAAEAIMRQLPIVQVPGLRKTFVKRPDAEALLERCTYAKAEVPGEICRGGRKCRATHRPGGASVVAVEQPL